MDNATFALQAKSIMRTFTDAVGTQVVLDNCDLMVKSGEQVAIVGPSGSGKTSLLSILGLLEPPNSGFLSIDKVSCVDLTDAERTKVRCSSLGYVYQFHHLLEELTAIENVSLPLLLNKVSRQAAKDRAEKILDKVGLRKRMHAIPSQLSGGERQRVAICRAVVHKPAIVIADEPTGNLDPGLAAEIGALFQEMARDDGVATVLATHDMTLASKMDRCLKLISGKLEG